MNDRKSIVLRDVKVRENALMKNVYLWMILGLAITAGVSFATANYQPLLRFVLLNPLVTIAVFIAQIVLVVMLSSRVERLSTGSAIGIFIGYSALTGLTLSSIFIAYTGTSIALAFVSAIAVFAGVGMIIASLISLFLSPAGYAGFNLVISAIGVVLFTGLTAWDSQRIADMNAMYGQDMTSEELTKIGILGALDLYLDFINIFLYLVRLFGRSDN